MYQTHGLRSTAEDRDLSRAASERYLMLQALSEKKGSPQNPATHARRWHPRRLLQAVTERP